MTSIQTLTATLDPRLRLGLALVLAMIMAALNQWQALSFAWLSSLFLLYLAHPNLKITLKRLLGVNFFLLLIWLFTPFATPGTPIYTLGPLQASYEGIWLSFLVTIKANALTCLFLAAFADLTPSVFVYALQSLHIHQKFVFLLLFTYHSLELLKLEWQALNSAVKLRGFQASFNWHTYKTIATLLGSLLLRSFAHAKRAHEAMLLRGFAGHFFAPREFKIQKQDILFSCLSFSLILIILYLELS